MAILSLRAHAVSVTLSLAASACSYDWKDKGTAADPMDNMDGGLDDDAGDAPDASPIVETGDDTPDAGPDAASEEPVTSCDDPSTAQCMPGDTVACTTSCGTQGSGACSDTCGPPVAAACTPPQEVCNWVDDDCDGAIDPGMLAQDPSKTRAVTVSGTGATVPILLARDGGGAWLLYLDNETVRSQLLDQHAQLSGSSAQLIGARVLAVRAVKIGSNIVVATNQWEGDTASIMLRIYRGSDLKLIDDYQLTGITGQCVSHGLLALSAYALPSGDLRVALVRGLGSGTYDPDDSLSCLLTLTGKLDFIVLTRSAAGTWTPPVVARQFGVMSPFAATPSRVVRVPCRDEWLLFESQDVNIQTGAGSWHVSRYATSGALLTSEVGSINRMQVAAIAEPASCSGSSAELTLLSSQLKASQEPSGAAQTYLARWQFDTTTGQRTAASEVQLENASSYFAAAASTRGNRVLIAAWDEVGVKLREEGLDAASTAFALSPSVGPADASIAFLVGADLLTLVDTGSAIAIAATVPSNVTTFDAYRAVGDTKRVGAVVYGLGCPSTP